MLAGLVMLASLIMLAGLVMLAGLIHDPRHSKRIDLLGCNFCSFGALTSKDG